MVTHLEVCSDKAMSFEVLKIAPHEQVKEKCGLQRKEGGGKEGARGRRKGGDNFLLRVRICNHTYLCSSGDHSGVAALENLELNKTRFSCTVSYPNHFSSSHMAWVRGKSHPTVQKFSGQTGNTVLS